MLREAERIRGRHVWPLVLVMLAGCTCLRPGPALFPRDAGPQAVREALVRHLDRQVLPLWTSPYVVDRARGGFFNMLDPSGVPVGQTMKPLIAQLRLLTMHAIAIERTRDAGERRRLRSQYDQGLQFLADHFRDADDGLWRSDVTSEGFPTGTPKRMVMQVYAVYALALCARRLGDDEALSLAEETFETMGKIGWDLEFGGYTCDPTQPAEHEVNKIRDVGTNFHALLAVVRLYQACPKAVYRDRARRLMDLITRHGVCAESGHGYLRLTRAWQPDPEEPVDKQATLYGHNAEMVWYTLEAARVLGQDVQKLRPWAETATAAFIRDAMHPDGPTYLLGFLTGGPTDKRVAFWCQAEAVVLFLRMVELTGDARYYELLDRVARWTFANMVNPQTGMWLAQVDPDGRPRYDHPGGTDWKAGLHVARMLLEAEAVLGRMARARQVAVEGGPHQ